jgi:predicted amidohydrolase
MKKVTQTLTLPTLLSSLVLLGPTAQQPEYDIVLEVGRLIDPETVPDQPVDAIRNVAIRGDRVVEISEGPLTGREIVDVSGLIVSPGFIDLHAHGQTNEANEYQAHDGVTTALELESGEPFLDH